MKKIKLFASTILAVIFLTTQVIAVGAAPAIEETTPITGTIDSITINTDKLIIEIADDGPGIVDIEKAMQTGFSTASDEHREMGFGAGMGLPNMKKNADEITVESEKSQGTRVRMVFFIDKGGDGG